MRKLLWPLLLLLAAATVTAGLASSGNGETRVGTGKSAVDGNCTVERGDCLADVCLTVMHEVRASSFIELCSGRRRSRGPSA